MEYFDWIGCDVHKDYSVFRMFDAQRKVGPPIRIRHENGELERFLKTLPPGSHVGFEACGSWMWMARQVEDAGLVPRLGHPLEIKRRTAGSTRTDETDSAGMLILLANGTFPEVWMAPPMVRDLRGLVRTRLAIRRQESAMKNRVHGVLNQYGLKNSVEEEDDVGIHDWFSRKAQEQLQRAIEQLPPASREATRQQWMAIQDRERRVKSLELAMEARMGKLGWLRLLQTLPGVGKILGATIWAEIGDGKRFPSAQHLARYAGVVPQVQSSGGKTWRGSTRKDCNHYLQWALVEAANTVAARRGKWGEKYPHAVGLYQRVKATTQLSGKAKVAVARHLAEAAWWVLTRKQDYREPTSARVTSSHNG